jgi:hypothetical protein
VAAVAELSVEGAGLRVEAAALGRIPTARWHLHHRSAFTQPRMHRRRGWRSRRRFSNAGKRRRLLAGIETIVG